MTVTTAYVPPDGTMSPTSAQQSAPQSQYVSPSGVVTPTEATTPASAYVSPSGEKTTPSSTILTTSSSTYVSQSEETVPYIGPQTTHAVISVSVVQITVADNVKTAGTLTFESTSTSSSTQSMSTASTGSAAPTGFVYPSGTVTVPSPTHTGLHDHNHDVLVYHWTPGKAFLGTYAPFLLAVVFRLLMSITLTKLSLIDPFRQLASSNGARAEQALFSFYQSSTGLLTLVKAIARSRWALTATAIAYIAACLLPALASEAIWADTNYGCEHPFYPGTNNPCAPRATVSQPVARLLQGLLAFDALVILVLALLLFFSRTGLPANPSSIATVASLMQHHDLTEDLSEMPVGHEANSETLPATLMGKRYVLDFWKSDNGGTSYGIRPVHSIQTESPASVSLKSRHSYAPICAGDSPLLPESGGHRYRWKDFALMFVVLGTFAVVLGYYLDGADDGFNGFFSSNTFGPRFVLTGAATVMARMWKTVEQSSVVMAPFIRLSQRPSSAGSTICFAPSNTPALSTWRTMRSRYWLLTALTLTTVLAEVLSIMISGVPYSTAQLWTEFLACAYISIGVLSIMIIVSVLVILHRRQEPRLPAKPDTLGTKMYYLAGSRMLDEFDGVEYESEEMRIRRIKVLRKKYEFGVMMRKDGRTTWLVEETRET